MTLMRWSGEVVVVVEGVEWVRVGVVRVVVWSQ